MNILDSLLFAAFWACVSAASTFSPARPPAIPLAVKSPYLSAWQQVGSATGNGGYLAGQWPTFWNGEIVGWTGLIRVDGQAYTWMGSPANNISTVNQTAFVYTATRSIFYQNVNGAVNITVTFLSPITPNDYTRASLISSYMEVEVSSMDGQPHQVELYTDITAEWISGDRLAVAQWDYGVASAAGVPSSTGIVQSQPQPTATPAADHFGTLMTYTGWTEPVTHPGLVKQEKRAAVYDPSTSVTSPDSTSYETITTTEQTMTTTSVSSPSSPSSTSATPPAPSGFAYHCVYRQTQLAFSEVNDQTEYGYWHYMTANTANLTHQSGNAVDVRGLFVSSGSLNNTADTNYRAINDSFPTFGFALDLGTVGATPVSNLFTINLNQQEAIVFEGSGGNQSQPSLWTSYFNSNVDADSFFYNDYPQAQALADTFDNKVASDSTGAAGSNYLLITTLSARQAFGSIQLTGTPNQTFVFLKEISSDGNVNTVDVLFPWHPIALYANPTLLKLALEPLFINQEAGYWPFAFAEHDIGSAYPNATGHNDGNAEQQPLEECGNMIIMALAYAQRANDNAWLSSHYTLLNQWVGYLIQEALIPLNQISTDDFAGALPNQTNLALKGIIGIQAMAEISNRTSHAADAANYTSIAASYITQWVTLATTTNATLPHTTLNYNNETTYSLLYNLWAAPLLSFGSFVPQQVYDRQSAFYPSVANKYGVPLDTRHSYTKLDWQLFCAAVATAATRDLFIADIAAFINATPDGYPLSDLYDTGNASTVYSALFRARPVVGGAFALLVLPEGSVPA